MEKSLKTVLLAIFLCFSLVGNAQSVQEKRTSILTPPYYTNWIGADFFTIATIEHECEVTPVRIVDLTFFYDFGTCFVGMMANTKGVITQMTLRLFEEKGQEFIQDAMDYGYERIGNGEDLNVRSNGLSISNVEQYRKKTEHGSVYLEVSRNPEFVNEYQIAIYRGK